jgi:multidrug efflux pump subunit AcrA (membrane-fusion protein)
MIDAQCNGAKTMRFIPAIILVLASALLLAACSGEAPPSSVPLKSIPASAVSVRAESIPDYGEAPGTVQARNRIVLSSQLNGFVREVWVRAGEAVTAGQVLVTLDPRDAQSQKDAAQAGIEEAQAALAEARRGAAAAQSAQTAAKAALDLASSTHARYQKLFESHSVSPQELDEVKTHRDIAAADLSAKEALAQAAQDRLRQIEARIAQADAQARRADVYVEYTVVKAPSAGRIVERNADPGSAIFPGSPLIIMESTGRPQVLASIPVADALHLRNGLEVRVRIQDQAPVQGRISQIISTAIPGSHTIQFKVDLPAESTAVSGSYAAVDVPRGTRSALLIPKSAVRESGQLAGVFVIDGSAKASYRLVKLTSYDEGQMEVIAGLDAGERLIAPITDPIVDGVPVEIRQ